MANRESNDVLGDGDREKMEEILASFMPRSAGVNHAQLMFRAGQESEDNSGNGHNLRLRGRARF